ncbi:MAG: CopG family transcriptional regulator [Jiangellaceae bacterium]
MSATRTQIYLTEEQRRRIDEVSQAEGVTLAEVVRRAVDVYLDQTGINARENLAATFGADAGAAYPDRREWDRG